jgi:hypothetical protein
LPGGMPGLPYAGRKPEEDSPMTRKSRPASNSALLSQLRTVAGTRRDATALVQEAIARRIGKRIPAGRYNLKRTIVVPVAREE